jgi:hypothetical protein
LRLAPAFCMRSTLRRLVNEPSSVIPTVYPPARARSAA